MSTNNLVFKQPIKHLEIPISKFNDIAIPHHLDLLRKHKNNIKKFQEARQWGSVYKEQVNATRLVKQLKQLLYEMDMLRSQVIDSDIDTFDQLTAFSRNSTIIAIQEYFDLEFDFPPARPASPKNEDQTTESPFQEGDLQLHAEQEELERQQACLHSWNILQNDMHQLHQLFIDFNKIVKEQKEHVNEIENNVEVAEVNVEKGTKFLEKAAKYKVAAYPLAGALIGTCVGGPIGLIAGIKLGGLTALGCGVLGFTGGTFLKKKHNAAHSVENKIEISETKETDVRASVSIPDNLKDIKKDL
ncbi:syntaxin-17 [Cephus cinctus]|uniref:Syntaxin-17 n=1 Tax=Cephus cinctus TaxID=211228 RepID=A0AAJ7C8D8_CEPCN|nr:syntaxin-17 [Cephus cinctus]